MSARILEDSYSCSECPVGRLASVPNWCDSGQSRRLFFGRICVMDDDYYHHPQRFPKNVPGPFYTLGQIAKDGTWCGQCLSCDTPEREAPTLLAPLTDGNSDTYFVRQPETDAEIEQACWAIEVCCVDALRYGGKDPKILARLRRTDCCDHQFPTSSVNLKGVQIKRHWWRLWK